MPSVGFYDILAPLFCSAGLACQSKLTSQTQAQGSRLGCPWATAEPLHGRLHSRRVYDRFSSTTFYHDF